MTEGQAAEGTRGRATLERAAAVGARQTGNKTAADGGRAAEPAARGKQQGRTEAQLGVLRGVGQAQSVATASIEATLGIVEGVAAGTTTKDEAVDTASQMQATKVEQMHLELK